ncbi:Annexin A5 [Globodera pallida]|nr:Annexin A5 [Globodera pallida]
MCGRVVKALRARSQRDFPAQHLYACVAEWLRRCELGRKGTFPRRSYSLWLQKSFTVVALLYMRQHECDFPRRKDALRTPIVLPLFCLCFFVSMLVISARKNPFIIIYTVVMLAIGLILYYIFIFPQRALPVIERINTGTYQLPRPSSRRRDGGTKSLRTNVGRVFASPKFDAKANADLLRKAMGTGSDKMTILQPLINCNNAQRQELVHVFKQMHGKDLVSELKRVSGEFQELIMAMMESLAIYDVEQLNRALKACEMSTTTDHFIYSFFHFRGVAQNFF